MVQRVGDLEIDQDLRFQEREWKIQRIGWVIMLLIVLLALTGVFSVGPLSSASVESGDGAISAGYERFVRYDSQSTVVFTVSGDQATNNEIRLWVAQDFLGKIDVQRISPQPVQTLGAGDRTTYVFAIADPSSTLQASFSIRPQDIGRYSVEAGVIDGPAIAFHQLSYP